MANTHQVLMPFTEKRVSSGQVLLDDGSRKAF